MSIEVPKRRSVGKLTFYTHSFIVNATDPRVIKACLYVTDKYSEKKWVKEKLDNGEYINRQVVDKVYGTIFPGARDYQFHKGQFNEFKRGLALVELDVNDFEVAVKEAHKPSKVSYKLREHRKLREYQVDAKGFALEPVEGHDHFSKLIAMPTGMGKALIETTKVITPQGLVALKDLEVGDEILAPDGTYTTVLGVYPQGDRPSFMVRTEDDRVAYSDIEHEWDVYVGDSDALETRTTGAIRALWKSGAKVSLPLFDPVDCLGEVDSFVEKIEEMELMVRMYGGVNDFHQKVSLKIPDRGRSARALIEKIKTLFYSLGGTCLEVDGQELVVSVPGMSMRLFSQLSPEDQAKLDSEAYLAKDEERRSLHINTIYENPIAPMICIEVDHWSNLFVLANYMVTHNTVTSCAIAADNETRWMVSILPKYKEKWGGDIVENLDLDAKKVMMIDSTDGLRGIIDHCKNHGTKKLQPTLVVTLTTLATFFKAYQKDPDGAIEDYGCAPMDMWAILDIGMVSVDEAHEHIYSVYLLALHLHGPMFVSMSGTMQAEDPFVEMIQNVVYPMIKRYNDVKMGKYINVELLEYQIKRELRHKVRYQVFNRQDYSHVELEKSIMRNKGLLNSFLNMWGVIVDYGYMQRRVAGDKMIIYAATVDMVNIIITYMEQRFPSANIKRYAKTEKDKYENILTADIIVSTLQSSGTAVDIPGLISNLCTTMVNSGKTNLQCLGRLRDLAGKEMYMFLPYCVNIRKHVTYTTYRVELFKDRVKTIKTFRYGTELG